MTDPRSPERLLAAWLATEAPPRPPDGLRDDILTATARVRPRPGWLAGLTGNHMDVIVGGRARRDPRLVPALVLLGLLLAAVAGAMLLGSRPVERTVVVPPSVEPSPRPPESAPPDSEQPASALGTCPLTGIEKLADTGSVLIPGTGLAVQYEAPSGLRPAMEAVDGMVGFGRWSPGLSTGYAPGADESDNRRASDARGVVVSDVTYATLHTSGLTERPRLGTDASSFLDDLRATTGFSVGPSTPVQLAGGRPATAAAVSAEQLAGRDWTHIDRFDGSERGCALELVHPSRLIVTDVGTAIVAMQIWAGTQEGLEAWTPLATELVESMRFTRVPLADPGWNAAALGDRADALIFAYRIPEAVELVPSKAESGAPPAPIIAFTEGGPGPYGFEAIQTTSTFVDGSRGVIVADVTGATTHDSDGPLGADAASFVAALDASEFFLVADVAIAELGGHPARAGTISMVSSGLGAHLDVGAQAIPISFGHPSRIIVADVYDRIVLAQIWAGTWDELEAWLPTAIEFVQSLRFADQP